MLGYATVGCNDLAAMAKFYDALAAAMGAARSMEIPDRLIAWSKPGGHNVGIIKPANGEPATVGNGVMVALAAKDKDEVDKAYAAAIANGGTCEGPPGPRGPTFYAAYFRDIEGNKLNAFCIVG